MDQMNDPKYRSKIFLSHSYEVGDVIHCHKTGEHFFIEVVDQLAEMYSYRILERNVIDQCYFEVLDYLVSFSKVA